MRIVLFALVLICASGHAEERFPKLASGTVFHYYSWGACIVASGTDASGNRIFDIEYSLRSGQVIHPTLQPSVISRIESLLSQLKSLSFKLPYNSAIYVADGEQVKVELRAGTYNLTYEDGFNRARKQPPISELVKLLISLQPKADSSIEKP